MSILLSVAVSLCFAHEANAARRVDVLEMDFVHFSLGHVRLITNKDFCRIISFDNHFEAAAKAPEWRIVSFNRNNHIFNETSVDTFTTFIGQMNDGWLLQFPADTQTKKITYAGMPAISRTLLVKGRTLGWSATFRGNRQNSEEAITYDGDMVSKTCAHIVNEMFDMHAHDAMYLALKFFDKKGTPKIRFECKKTFRTTVAKEFFDLPSGFSKGTIAQVLGNAPANLPGVKSMIEDMGLGKSF